MDIYKALKHTIVEAAQGLAPGLALPLESITAEPPRDPSHGDVATNVAMVLAKPLGQAPRALAEKLAEQMQSWPEIKSTSVAGPGFINLTLKEDIWQGLIRTVLKEGQGYGNLDIGGAEKVNIEYVSANPTGPMHVGHSRNAVYGDVLASLLMKAGYNVTKEFYINDAGAQVEALTKSAYLRYREACGEEIGPIPEGLYPGEYLKDVGEALKVHYGTKLLHEPELKALPLVRSFTLEAMMAIIRADLLELGVEHDVFTSEKALQEVGAVQAAFNVLEQKGLIYQGTLPPPKGKEMQDWEPKELTLFKASLFGDDSDRPLKKSDGNWAYIAPDIAYHYDKLKRGFKKMVLVLGADHAGYQKRLQAAVAALSDREAELSIQLYQMVNLFDNGMPLKMSKRSGSFISLREVVEAVGKDVVRFMMLTRKHSEVLDFDFKKVTEQSKDNPVFYVQYAHARISSVFRHAAEDIPEALKGIEGIEADALRLLTHPAELDLIKMIAQWPRVVESAARQYEPHRLTYYLYDLANAFHVLWNKGKEDTGLRFLIQEDIPLTRARLALVKACAITIASGLGVFGVEPVTQM